MTRDEYITQMIRQQAEAIIKHIDDRAAEGKTIMPEIVETLALCALRHARDMKKEDN